METWIRIGGIAMLLGILGAAAGGGGETTRLPAPDLKGRMAVEAAIQARRSIRSFADRKLTLAELGQLAWSAQGITEAAGKYRAAPSAGALYPMEIYLVVPEGVYHYLPNGHRLSLHKAGDLRDKLAGAALGQEFVARASVDVVVVAVYQRVTRKYGDRGRMYVHMEAGHIGQNVLLQATAMGLAGTPVGAFEDAEVKRVLSLPPDGEPLYIISVGQPSAR